MRFWLYVAVFVVLYFAAAKLGFSMAYIAEQVTVVWAPTGLSIALIAFYGARLWPAVFAGAFLANVTTSTPAWAAVAIAAGNTLEAVSAAWMLERVPNFSWRMRRIQDAASFIILAAIVSPIISATIGTLALCLAGEQSWLYFVNVWAVWWLGDALGAMVAAPVFLTWTRSSLRNFARRPLEAAALAGCVLLLLTIVFQYGADVRFGGVQYLIFPLLIWAALSFGTPGAALASFVTAALTVWQTSRGVGPFSSGATADDLVLLQLFMATVSSSSLLLAASISDNRKQHALMRAVTEASSDAIFVKDLQGRYLAINSAGARVIGRPADEIIGRDDSQLLPADAATTLMAGDRAIMASGVGNTAEETVTLGGDTRTFFTLKAPYRDGNQEVIGVIGISRDITEPKVAEQARRSEYELRKAIESSIRAGIVAMDLEGRQVYANPAFCEMVGWREEELLGRKPPFVFWPEEEAATIHRALQAQISGQTPREGFELRFKRRNGEIFPVDLALSPLHDSAGKIRWWVGSVHDVTSQVRIREALQHSEERYRSLVVATSQVVWHTTADGQVQDDLPTWRDYTGQAPEKALGRGWLSMVHPDDVPLVVRRWEESLENCSPHENEFRVRVADGSYRNVHARAVPVLDERGVVREWIGTLTDVTESKVLERKRAELLEVEQDLNRRKDDFLAMLAHELRNPLAPILTAVAVLENKASDTMTERGIGIIKRQAQHLTRIVDDLLDVARITRGTIEVRAEVLDLRDIVRSVYNDLRTVIATREQEFTCNLPDAPVPVHGDRTRLEQVVTNLVQNASKYTPAKGSIALSVAKKDLNALLRVSDTGRGIAKEFLPHMFDLFAQEDRSLDRSRGGLGLGLSIVRSIVDLHGGQVHASSEGEGKGTEVTVLLPLTAEQRPSSGNSVHEAAPPLRIMIVEDNEDAADTLAMLLSLEGHEVRVFNNAYAALDGAASFTPQIVLLDVGLPGLSGYEAAPRIRAAHSGTPLKIVALTGYGQSDDRRRTAAAGFDYHLVKPAPIESLIRLLRELSEQLDLAK
jgi:two-component system CheB/CheR fusion protein